MSILILAAYWFIMFYIIFVMEITDDVKNIKGTPNDAPITQVTENVETNYSTSPWTACKSFSCRHGVCCDSIIIK